MPFPIFQMQFFPFLCYLFCLKKETSELGKGISEDKTCTSEVEISTSKYKISISKTKSCTSEVESSISRI